MKTIKILLAAVSAIMMMSCNKDVRMGMPETEKPGAPISFLVSGLDDGFSTKTTPLTSLDSFYVMANTGTIGSETYSWNAVATRSGDSYATNKYWPASNPLYHFYASNAPMSFTPAGATVAIDCTEDIVCAFNPSPSFNAPATIVFQHILSRVGTVAVTAAAGYTLTVNSVGIKKLRTSGTMNIRNKGWTGTNEIQLQAIQVGNNDLYIVPGEYDVSVNFSLSKGDFSGTYTSAASVAFPAGKICNLAIDITKDPAVRVDFQVTITPWEAMSIPVTLK